MNATQKAALERDIENLNAGYPGDVFYRTTAPATHGSSLSASNTTTQVRK